MGLTPEDRPKAAFSFPGGGLWQFTVMAFGLCNAPAAFERLMEKSFKWPVLENMFSLSRRYYSVCQKF